MAFITFNGIDIPKARDIRGSYDLVEDSERTQTGRLRSDTIAIKRVWEFDTAPLTPREYSPILSYYESTMGAEGAFIVYGEPPAIAKLNIQYDTIRFSRDGVFYPNGKVLHIRAVEV
jgi:hypothetical protein